jgi:NADPH:quinone reductase-like Zn-dependent oxidoreductase
VVINYKAQHFDKELRDLDMVFDLIGGETQDKSWGS